MSDHLSSYGQIFTLGHRYLANLFTGPVVIQEKIDGSQFSFGVLNGVLHCRSKGQGILKGAPGMFKLAVETAERLFFEGHLIEGYVYRCEFLAKPKHNALTYSRVPRGNLVLFDVERSRGSGDFLPMAFLLPLASLLGIEPVPVLFDGEWKHPAKIEGLKGLLDAESCLGGCKIEGIVIKNYNQFGEDKKIVVGKFVSDAFKEVHRHEWKKANPTQNDIVQRIISDYKTSPRWQKAVQHLRDAGTLVDAPQDIGPLINEIQHDVKEEDEDMISARLFNHFWPQISRGIIAGFPEWYKAKLAEQQNLDGAASVSYAQGTIPQPPTNLEDQCYET